MVRALLLLLLSFPAFAAEPTRHEWTVDGVKREGLVALPVKPKGAPVVFAFHGHGGSMRNAARTFDVAKHWPDAIAVYLQGLPTPGRLTDPEGKKAGWQHSPGDQSDRDLKFFDTVFDWLKKEHSIDEKRIYSTGHSNGGGFTYLLWAKRGDVFAAVAPSAAAGAARLHKDLKPLPVMHLAGEKDELVKFEWQKATIDVIKKVNGCDTAKGESWESKATIYQSKDGPPVVAFIHAGTHAFPSDGAALIAKFFQQYAKK
jgi:polyhydroxybutyrate depolymerase